MQTFLTDYCEVSHTDWGVYRCRARNTMGMGEAIVVLKSKFRGWQGFQEFTESYVQRDP